MPADSALDAMTGAAEGESDVLLSVRGLKKHFPVTKGIFRRQVGAVRAVDGVSFDIRRGETLGLVGESGSGKSTIGRTILQLEKATEGSVVFDGVELVGLAAGELRRTRPRMQMVFQDPHASLNPRMTVSSIVGEPLLEHRRSSTRERQEKVEELLGLVGLDPRYANRYPHEFSGGQRQRIGIARAIALNPDFIVCDEPIAALDVSIQAQVVNLMEELQDLLGLTYLFISHDLGMIRHIADRVAVMYLGKLCEVGGADQLYADPAHPYTEILLGANPEPDPEAVLDLESVEIVDLPSPIDPPSGCRFRTRCPRADERCTEEEPQMRQVSAGHHVACHHPLVAVAG